MPSLKRVLFLLFTFLFCFNLFIVPYSVSASDDFPDYDTEQFGSVSDGYNLDALVSKLKNDGYNVKCFSFINTTNYKVSKGDCYIRRGSIIVFSKGSINVSDNYDCTSSNNELGAYEFYVSETYKDDKNNFDTTYDLFRYSSSFEDSYNVKERSIYRCECNSVPDGTNITVSISNGLTDFTEFKSGVRIVSPVNNSKVYIKNYGGSKHKVFQIPVTLECKIPIDFDMTTASKLGWILANNTIPYYQYDMLTDVLNDSLFIETYAQDKTRYKCNPKFFLDGNVITSNLGLNRFSGPRDFAQISWVEPYDATSGYMHFTVNVLLDVDCSSAFKFNTKHEISATFSAPTKVTFELLGPEFSDFKSYKTNKVVVVPQVHVDLDKDGIDDRDGSQIGDNDCVDTKNKDGTGIDTITGDNANKSSDVYTDKDTVSVDDVNDTDFFSKVSKFVKSVGGIGTDIGDFINCIFGVFPSPIPELMIAAFVIMILMTVVHFIRG